MESSIIPGLFVGGGGGRIEILSSVAGFAVATGLTGTTGPSPSQFILNERGVPARRKKSVLLLGQYSKVRQSSAT